MKLYIKINDIQTFKNLESLLKGRYTLLKKLLEKDYPIEYRANIQSLENLQNNKHLFFTQRDIRKEIKGIYFGNDSCEHLIPSLEEIKEVFDFTKEKKLNFTLVLPPVSEFTIDKLEYIFQFLNSKNTEIVVNDFGALNLSLKYKNIKVIAGLTFSKLIKPAFLEISNQNQKELITHAEVEIDYYRQFFKSSGISRFSFENIDIDYSFLNEKPYVNIDLYYPFIKISYSKACNIAGLFNNIQNYFPVEHCSAYCKDVAFDIKDVYFGIFQRYNSFYKLNQNLDLPKEVYSKKQNRLIWEIFL